MTGVHRRSQATATLALGSLSSVQFVDIVVCEQTKHFNLFKFNLGKSIDEETLMLT